MLPGVLSLIAGAAECQGGGWYSVRRGSFATDQQRMALETPKIRARAFRIELKGYEDLR